jgi:hypothetical protein
MIALLDNTVLSNFATVERPDLIHRALGDATATVAHVYQELQNGVALRRIPACDWSWLPILELDPSAQSLYAQLRTRLDAGEAACLALAAVHHYRVLTDDRDARAIAAEMQIPISGTLGVLMRVVDLGHMSIDAADPLLEQMVEAGYRSPVTSLHQLL